nr:hypothetical protein [Tanacetum cinerariifolium]
MDMTIDQQVALDKALVPYASRLRIGKSNFRLKSDISSKESTLQLVYYVMRLTPFYMAFLVTADVPGIYMQELWVIVMVHHHFIRFKMENKKHIVNLENFREMLHICPRLPGQTFDELSFEEEIMVIIHYFMSTDPLILRRNKVNWHYVRDDQMFTTIKLVLRHHNTQQFGAMLPIELTNEYIRNSEAYKEYYAVATGAAPPKTKASVRKTKSCSDIIVTPPAAATSTRLSISSKGKQPANASKATSLTVLSEVAMTEAEQLKLATKKACSKLISPKLVVWVQIKVLVLYQGFPMYLLKSLMKKFLGNQLMNKMMMMRTKMKNPPLDQSGGPRGKEKERSQSQQALQRRKQPGQLASLHKGPNHNKRLQASLHQQMSQCGLLMIWKIPHIKSLSIQPWISKLAKQADSRSSFNELMATPVDFSAFLMNQLKVDNLTPELLAGPTYELMKGSCKSLVELEFFLKEVYKSTTDQLDWNNPEGQQYPHNLLKPLTLIPNSRAKTKAAYYGHIKWIEDLFYGFAVNGESVRDVYSKRRIIAVTELQIIEWYNYKHLDWITVRREDDKLYKYKEVEERFAFNVSLRMFTRSIVIQIHVEDLQLGVKIYQKKLNLTRPFTFHSDLKRKEAYTAYSNLRGLIY